MRAKTDGCASRTGGARLAAMTSRVTYSLLALVLLLAGGAVAFYLYKTRQHPGAETVSVSIGRTRLVVPMGYARSGAEAGGAVERLDLAATYPDFLQAGAIAGAGDTATPDTLTERLIFITLAPEDTLIAPQDRPSRLYARFLESDVWSHGGGLIMRRFQDQTPFEKEDLYMTPPEGRAFFARCLRPEGKAGGVPHTCISETRVGAVDVQVRFSSTLLSEWERVMDGSRGLVQKLIR